MKSLNNSYIFNEDYRNNRKTIYLHIGPHRTGTTYLQNVFYNRKSYFEKNSILYLDPVDPYSAHNVFFSNNINREAVDQMKSSLSSSHCKFGLVSSEELINVDPENILEAFDGYNIYPIMCIRNPLDLIKSNWSIQVTDAGNLASLPDLLSSNFFGRLSNNIRKWHSTFESTFLSFPYSSATSEHKLLTNFISLLNNNGALIHYDKDIELFQKINFGLDFFKTLVFLGIKKKINSFQFMHDFSNSDNWYLLNFVYNSNFENIYKKEICQNNEILGLLTSACYDILDAYSKIIDINNYPNLNIDIDNFIYPIIKPEFEFLFEMIAHLVCRLIPVPSEFSEDFYNINNPDVLSEGSLTACNHWRRYGWTESRKYS